MSLVVMSVTIKDIAKRAGISVSTVSKAINDRSDVSDALKIKVKSLAKEMGYSKNIMASRLVNKKSNTIGVFVFYRNKLKKESETTAFKYIKTLLDETKKNGYDLVLFSTDKNSNEIKSYIDLCTERQIEGAIFIGFESGDKKIDEIIESDLPVVMIEGSNKGDNVSSVTFDNLLGMTDALDYLQILKHKDIAFIKGKETPISQGRLSIYKNYMNSKNIYNESRVFLGDYTLESGYNVGLEIIKLDKLPTAIISSNDLMAIGVIRALNDNNIRIPEDISIIGYDDFEISKYVQPRLTTVSQDFYAVGIKSVEILLNMINNKADITQIVLEPKLIIRESCCINNR